MWKYTYSRQNKQNGENLSTCTVHCHNIGRTFNLHPYRESGQTHRKHGKDIHAPFCTKICNETSLDLKTVAKIVVSIDIKQHIRVFFAQFIWYCAKWKEWKTEKKHFEIVCEIIFVFLQSVINSKRFSVWHKKDKN